MKQQKQSGFAHLMVVTVILGLVVIGLLGYVLWQNFMQPKDNVAKTGDSSKVAEKDDKKEVESNNDVKLVELGTIEGYLTYPSDHIPDSLVVYAENKQTGEEYSTREHIKDSKYRNGIGFKLEVPKGDYYIYGMVDGNSTKAYFNDNAVCNSSGNCASRDTTKKIVSVDSSQTTSGIVVGDWWTN